MTTTEVVVIDFHSGKHLFKPKSALQGQDQDHRRRVRLQPIKYGTFRRRKDLPSHNAALADCGP